MKWYILAVDERYFNWVSSFISVFTKQVLLVTLSSFYGTVLAMYLSRRGSQIPVYVLGDVPNSVFQALGKFVRKYLKNNETILMSALPIVILILLFACADFSDSMAKLGLKAVDVVEEGPMDVVLSLRTEDRNQERVLETAGDPEIVGRTYPITTSDSLGATGADAGFGMFLVHSFMTAVNEIAAGESAFTTTHDVNDPMLYLSAFQSHEVAWGGEGILSIYPDIGAALSSIPLEIPLNCLNNTNDFMVPPGEMVALEQIQVDHSVTSTVAPCTFAESRQTGIYTEQDSDGESVQSEQAVILEHAFVWSNNTDATIGLVQGGQVKREVVFSAEDRKLARDRADWRKGRVVQDIEGLQIGSLKIPLASAVISAGQLIIADDSDNRKHWYLLVGEVQGACPRPPSGQWLNDDLSCLVLCELLCNQFPEDIAIDAAVAEPDQSGCFLYVPHVVWGANFVADSDMAAVVAGIYGNLQPRLYDIEGFTFFVNVIPAALFALSTTDLKPSRQTIVRPSINVVYMTFMAIPIVLAVALLSVVCFQKEKGKNIPITPYEMIILGQKQSEVVRQLDYGGNTRPNVNNRLVYDVAETVEDDGAVSEGMLELVDDPHRPLEDPMLCFFVRRKLKAMSEEEKMQWMNSRVDGIPNPNERAGRWAKFLDKRIDDRFEFLNSMERRQYLGMDTGNDIETSMEASGPSETHVYCSCPSERVKICDEKARCVICAVEAKKEEGRHYHCKHCTRGCPSCQVVVCKEHWSNFDHNPSDWA